MKALVVGGAGPTGPFIVRGLLDRGYDIAILHRGKHEVEEIPPEVEHMRVPGSSRSVFRDDGDQRSDMMAISIPTSSRSAFRDDRDQMRVVLAV